MRQRDGHAPTPAGAENFAFGTPAGRAGRPRGPAVIAAGVLALAVAGFGATKLLSSPGDAEPAAAKAPVASPPAGRAPANRSPAPLTAAQVRAMDDAAIRALADLAIVQEIHAGDHDGRYAADAATLQAALAENDVRMPAGLQASVVWVRGGAYCVSTADTRTGHRFYYDSRVGKPSRTACT